MNQNVKITNIISKLNEIDELLKSFNDENMSAGQAKFSIIDKDMILEKIRNIYDTALLNKSECKTSEIIPEIKAQIPIEKPIIKEIQTETIETPENVNDSILDFTEKPIEKSEVAVEEKKPIISSLTLFEVEPIIPQNTIKTEDPISVKKEKVDSTKQSPSSKTISDQYRESKTQTVSDLMSKFNRNDVSAKQNLNPIKNLKSAISINDRIMFTNELFDNNPDLYNEVIEKINGMNNFNEALEYLKIEIDLTEESEAIQKFTELVHRRFL